MTNQFEAWAECPKCEAFAVHAIRAPKTFPPSRGEIASWEARFEAEERRQVRSVAWYGGGTPVRVVKVKFDEPYPFDETPFDVIRVCECGHEWGQK
jgi:hypothetical protein